MQIRSLKIRPVVSIVFLIIVTFFCKPCFVEGESVVRTDKDVYNQGEVIRVNFTNAPGDDNDWICIVPVGSSDTDGGDYKYMHKGLGQGFLIFDPPSPGKYEVRAYYNYKRNGYVVSGRYAFSVLSRFIAYSNGTVLDTKTNLMWAAKDNGTDIYWANAKSYCENYRGGGYTDWRMPTCDELAGLYDTRETQRNEENPSYSLHLTELIDVTTCCAWASETRGSTAAIFDFGAGKRNWFHQSLGNFYHRALPVRSGK